MTNNEEYKIVSVRLGPQLLEFIRKIGDKLDMNTSNVIKQAIREYHASEFKDYVVAKGLTSAKTPEEKAEEKVRMAEHKKKLEEDGYLAILNKLGGRVLTKPDGKYAQYYTYHKNTRYLQEMPLEMMSEDLCEAQYSPTKEDVLGRQERGEVAYKLNTWDE